MTDTLTIDGTVVDRSEAEASAKKSAATIVTKLNLAAKHSLAAALELLKVKSSETYFAVVSAEDLEKKGSGHAWSTFYGLCNLSSSKASRMLSHAKAVTKLIEVGVEKKVAHGLSQDTATTAGQLAKKVGWTKVGKTVAKLGADCTTAALEAKLTKGKKKGEKDKDPKKDQAPTKPIDTLNEALTAVERQFKSSKPIDYDKVDWDLVDTVRADLEALEANRPS